MKNFVLLTIAILFLFVSPVMAEEQSTMKPTILEGDLVLGNPEAKVIIFEFSTLACPHCADFHLKTFPEIKKNYIDTGKVRYVFKDFPVNLPSTYASMLVHCSKDRWFNVLTMLFESQNVWAFTYAYKEKLKNFARLSGMNDMVFDSCMNDDVAKDAILKKAYEGSKDFKISNTPTFIFQSGKRIEGAVPFRVFASKVDSELKIR